MKRTQKIERHQNRWTKRISIVKIFILCNAVYRFNEISFKITEIFFWEQERNNFKLIGEIMTATTTALITKIVLAEKHKARLKSHNFKAYLKNSNQNNTVLSNTKTHRKQNQIENLNVNLLIYSESNLTNILKLYIRERTIFSRNGPRNTNNHVQ